jgi:NDP-sugar pyrophosphorylase family protein
VLPFDSSVLVLHLIGHVWNCDDYEILEAVMAKRGIVIHGEKSIVGYSVVVPEACIGEAVEIVRSMPWIESKLLSETLPIHRRQPNSDL